MKLRSEVSAEKLRGGFYTPAALVSTCLRQIAELIPGGSDLRMLEPAVGDGAFVRGIVGSPLERRIQFIEGIEVIPEEARKAETAINAIEKAGEVAIESALIWAGRQHRPFDIAVGNPPFVRFQFVSEDDKAAIAGLGSLLGVSLRAVSNLWIPVLLIALTNLRDRGAFAFVVPTELLTGISASAVRQWLFHNASDLRVQLYPPGSFPGVLQEVAVLSGRRTFGPAGHRLALSDSRTVGVPDRWSHRIDPAASTWTRLLLPAGELAAFEGALREPGTRRLGEIAKFEVAAVTGANDFFSVSDRSATEHGLSEWVRPLLPRARLAPGLRYTPEDHRALVASGARSGLLDFSSTLPDPLLTASARAYLESGERAGLDQRYKTRIRTPWYRVPHIRPGRLMLSKRSHRHPRLILNEAGAVTTDTLYRGWMRSGFEGREEDLTAIFQNSLTLLSAEIEGRSFGGGVLELVPTEINRLAVPFVAGAGALLDELSNLTATAGGEVSEQLIDRTDRFLVQHGKIDRDALDALRSAMRRLQARRLDRGALGSKRGLAA